MNRAKCNEATLTGTPPAWSANTYPGGFGSISLDGASDYLALTSAPLAAGLSSFTISAWINLNNKAKNPGNDICYLGPASGTQDKVILFTVQSSSIFCSFWADDLSVSYSPANGSWNQAAITFDGTTRTIYVNGVSVASGTPTGTLNLDTTAFTFSRRTPNAPNGYLNGFLADARIHNRALSDPEINQSWRASMLGYRNELNWIGRTVFPAAAAAANYCRPISGFVGGFSCAGSGGGAAA